MKKRNLTIPKSPVLNGSTSRRFSIRATQYAVFQDSFIGDTPASSMNSQRIKPMACMIHGKQTTRHTCGESMPSTKGCGSYAMLHFKTLLRISCTKTNRRKLLRGDLPSANQSSPMLRRIRSIDTSPVPTGAGLSIIGARLRGAEPSPEPNLGRIGYSLI